MKQFNILFILTSFAFLTGCHDEKSEIITEKEVKAVVVNEHFLSQDNQPKIDESNIVLLPQSGGENICYKITPTKTMLHTYLKIEDSPVDLVSVRDLDSGAYYTLEKGETGEVSIDFLKGKVYEYCVNASDTFSGRETSFVLFTTTKNESDEDAIHKLITTRSCTGSSCNLNNADLSDLNLSGVNVNGALMLDTILTNSDLSDSNMSGTKIREVNLLKTIMDGVAIDYDRFSFTNAAGASFRGTTFPQDFDFSINPTHPQTAPPYYKGVDFTGANLQTTKMQGVDFSYAIFRDANFSGANLDGTNFSYVDFFGADMTQVKKMNGANFSHAKLSGFDLDTLETIYKSQTTIKDTESNFFKIIKGDPLADRICLAIPNATDQIFACMDKKYQSLNMVFLTIMQWYQEQPEKHGKKCIWIYPVNDVFAICVDDKTDFWINWVSSYSESLHSSFFIENIQESQLIYNCQTEINDIESCFLPNQVRFGF